MALAGAGGLDDVRKALGLDEPDEEDDEDGPFSPAGVSMPACPVVEPPEPWTAELWIGRDLISGYCASQPDLPGDYAVSDLVVPRRSWLNVRRAGVGGVVDPFEGGGGLVAVFDEAEHLGEEVVA